MSRWSIEVRSQPEPGRLAEDVRAGLALSPVTFPPEWFYDEKGSQLFDASTELPEYYPTRTEQQILEQHASEFPLVGTLVELGADLDPDDFDRVARFDEAEQRIERRL